MAVIQSTGLRVAHLCGCRPKAGSLAAQRVQAGVEGGGLEDEGGVGVVEQVAVVADV